MMEGQVEDATAVATSNATAPGFFDQDSPYLLLPTGDALPDATFATPAVPSGASRLVVKLDPTVVLAETELCRAVSSRRPTLALDQRNGRGTPFCHERMFVDDTDG